MREPETERRETRKSLEDLCSKKKLRLKILKDDEQCEFDSWNETLFSLWLSLITPTLLLFYSSSLAVPFGVMPEPEDLF